MRASLPSALLGLVLLLNAAQGGEVVGVPLPPDEMLLTWSPEPDADSYHVYGVTSGGARVLLASTTDTYAVVPAGYAEYRVAAVVDGVETSECGTCVFLVLEPFPHFEFRPC